MQQIYLLIKIKFEENQINKCFRINKENSGNLNAEDGSRTDQLIRALKMGKTNLNQL